MNPHLNRRIIALLIAMVGGSVLATSLAVSSQVVGGAIVFALLCFFGALYLNERSVRDEKREQAISKPYDDNVEEPDGDDGEPKKKPVARPEYLRWVGSNDSQEP